MPLFLLYGLGQGLAQPALINTVVGSAGVSGEDAGSAAGLFLTTAQSSIAFGVAAIGDVFFARLGDVPTPATICRAVKRAVLQPRAAGGHIPAGPPVAHGGAQVCTDWQPAECVIIVPQSKRASSPRRGNPFDVERSDLRLIGLAH